MMVHVYRYVDTPSSRLVARTRLRRGRVRRRGRRRVVVACPLRLGHERRRTRRRTPRRYVRHAHVRLALLCKVTRQHDRARVRHGQAHASMAGKQSTYAYNEGYTRLLRVHVHALLYLYVTAPPTSFRQQSSSYPLQGNTLQTHVCDVVRSFLSTLQYTP
jgi:hypothetical protein